MRIVQADISASRCGSRGSIQEDVMPAPPPHRQAGKLSGVLVGGKLLLA